MPAAGRLGEIRVPTLILVGEYDIPDVQAHAGAIQLGIWAAHRDVIPDAGHLIQLDRPRLVSDTIAAFINQSPLAVVSLKRLQEVAGSYAPFVRNEPGSFYVRNDRLWGHMDGQRDFPLYASSDSTFYLLFNGFHVTFHRDAAGQATGADISVRGTTHLAGRAGQ